MWRQQGGISNIWAARNGRGRGIGKGDLPRRTDEQLAAIARFIDKEIEADLIALQEVGLTRSATGYISEPLEKIVASLGEDWRYVTALPRIASPSSEDGRNPHTAFLWNSRKVRLVTSFSADTPDIEVGGVRAFERRPLVGYFQVLKKGRDTTDFILVDVHFARGQDNDENHLVAMVMIEQAIEDMLKEHSVEEEDQIILGDFNDNPFVEANDGSPKYTNLMYRYMRRKKFKNLVTEETGHTRMDSNRDSIIDNVLVNKDAMRQLSTKEVDKYSSKDSTDQGLAEWRKTYSDHFPLVFRIKIEAEDDYKDGDHFDEENPKY